MSRVFIGIGSNEGERLEHISHALALLAVQPGVRLVQMATILETAPVGGPPQGPYLNTVVELDTTLEPAELLRVFKQIERVMGRLPTAPRWGPRPMDLDLLLYEDRVIATPELTVPHLRMHERSFVLEPLAQLAPTLAHPVLKRTIAELLAALPQEAQ